LVYGLIIIIRNFLFDKKIIRSVSFNLPIICVGNLSVGGTGKSPLVEYLISLFHPTYKLATLSRGYKRKTKGYALANENTTALDIGDEPMQFHAKFPDIAVAVGEERIVAIPQLLQDQPGTQVIILDDAFQHRSIKAGLNIVLTDYNNLFTRDFFLPTGDLRDQRSSYKRAEIIIVTKCPATLSFENKQKVLKEIDPLPNQKVFFTTIKYGSPYHITSKQKKSLSIQDDVLLVCGIANPVPLKTYIGENSKAYYQMLFSDHHIFTIDDLKKITGQFEDIEDKEKMILTTEKDAVRLIKFQHELNDIPLFVLPISVQFLFDDGKQFDDAVLNFIDEFNLQNK
jgi:tetraacyldisaccharide 4'-kinase